MVPAAGIVSPPSGRKRRRNQSMPGGHSSLTPAVILPRVTTAPGKLDSSSPIHARAITRAKPPPILSQHHPLMDNSELESQINTLSLLHAHGYGPVPGTPLLRSKTAASIGTGRRHPPQVKARASTTKSETRGARLGRSRDLIQAADRQGNGANVGGNVRERWRGPMEHATRSGQAAGSHREGASASCLSVTIERDEFEITKAKREASAKGRSLLSQLTRVVHRRDLCTATQLLKSARAAFRAAGDANGIAEVDTTLIKIKADIVVQAVEDARKAREYDRMHKFMVEALHYYTVLAQLGRSQGLDTLSSSERREIEGRAHERFRHPRRRAREYALEDGRVSRAEGVALSRKLQFVEARSRLHDARVCFDWARGAEVDQRELQHAFGNLEMREKSTCGDRLAEGVASKLQFLTSKDYPALFSDLSEAAAAYEVAKDRDGAQVVRMVSAGLGSVQRAEERWLELVEALAERRYSAASINLQDARSYLADATRGMPFIGPSMMRAAKTLSPAVGPKSIDIIAELAAHDGFKDHNKCIRALDKGNFDEAQRLNTSARIVLEFTARCCGSAAPPEVSTTSKDNSRGAAAQGDGEALTSPAETQGSLRRLRPSLADVEAAAPATSQAVTKAGDFAPSAEELEEAEAVVIKIRRIMSVPPLANGSNVESTPSSTVLSGVRFRVEDLLDEISETEDTIIRNKARERGDELMSLFWETVTQAAVEAAEAAVIKASERAKVDTSQASKETSNVKAVDGGCSSDHDCISGRNERSGNGSDDRGKSPNRALKTILCGVKVSSGGHSGLDGNKKPVRGGAMTPALAERCLGLLADAKEAYEWQGFNQQANDAARLRAGIVADRFLVKARSLASPASTTATHASTDATNVSDAVGAPTAVLESSAGDGDGKGIAAGDDSSKAQSSKAAGVADITAARAAAREAEEHYARADNNEGALKARRTEVALRGDKAMIAVASLLEQRAYDAALERLNRARRLYSEAGPQGLQGLSRTSDPAGVVKSAAMRDGGQLKVEALQLLRDGDIETSTKLRQQAQKCYSFVNAEELANVTADVAAAIDMVRHLASGDAIVTTAEASLTAGVSGRAVELLQKAKLLYHEAQTSYENLVDQVTNLLEERPDDLTAIAKARNLQDNINSIYDSRRDGQRIAKVESYLDCLAADTSLEKLAQVVDTGRFADAVILLKSAREVYERSGDHHRLLKVAKIANLVGLVESVALALEEGRYDETESLVAECLRMRTALAVEQPISLRPPDCALFRDGENGAKIAVLLRVRAAGDRDRAAALELLEKGNYEGAEDAATSAAARFEWWAGHISGTDSGNDKSGDNDDCKHGDSHSLSVVVEDRDDPQAVVRAAKGLRSMITSAAGQARANTLIAEGRRLKSTGDYSGAVQALSAAANLFHSAGFPTMAAVARVEASRTEAQSMLLVSFSLHREGKFEAIAEHVRNAEAVLLEAIETETKARTAAVATTSRTHCELNTITSDGTVATDGDYEADITSGDMQATTDEELQGDLSDLLSFKARLAGDIVMRGVTPALEAEDYDTAQQLMLDADAHYARIKEGKWAASAVTSAEMNTSRTAIGAIGTASMVKSPPREWIAKRAAQDGDRLTAEASFAIQKDKNLAKSKALLSQAEACMSWAGVDPYSTGAAAVAKDIKVFESRTAGDEICRGLIGLLRAGETKLALNTLENALIKYRQGDAFKQVADTRAITFCVEREVALCSNVACALKDGDPVDALKVLEEARPVFKMAADLKSGVLEDTAELMRLKHAHIVLLSDVCRAWIQRIKGISSASVDDEDTSPTAGALTMALSNLRAAKEPGELPLDISLNLVNEACIDTKVTAAITPSTPQEGSDAVIRNHLQESMTFLSEQKPVPIHRNEDFRGDESSPLNAAESRDGSDASFTNAAGDAIAEDGRVAEAGRSVTEELRAEQNFRALCHEGKTVEAALLSDLEENPSRGVSSDHDEGARKRQPERGEQKDGQVIPAPDDAPWCISDGENASKRGGVVFPPTCDRIPSISKMDANEEYSINTCAQRNTVARVSGAIADEGLLAKMTSARTGTEHTFVSQGESDITGMAAAGKELSSVYDLSGGRKEIAVSCEDFMSISSKSSEVTPWDAAGGGTMNEKGKERDLCSASISIVATTEESPSRGSGENKGGKQAGDHRLQILPQSNDSAENRSSMVSLSLADKTDSGRHVGNTFASEIDPSEAGRPAAQGETSQSTSMSANVDVGEHDDGDGNDVNYDLEDDFNDESDTQSAAVHDLTRELAASSTRRPGAEGDTIQKEGSPIEGSLCGGSNVGLSAAALPPEDTREKYSNMSASIREGESPIVDQRGHGIEAGMNQGPGGNDDGTKGKGSGVIKPSPLPAPPLDDHSEANEELADSDYPADIDKVDKHQGGTSGSSTSSFSDRRRSGSRSGGSSGSSLAKVDRDVSSSHSSSNTSSSGPHSSGSTSSELPDYDWTEEDSVDDVAPSSRIQTSEVFAQSVALRSGGDPNTGVASDNDVVATVGSNVDSSIGLAEKREDVVKNAGNQQGPKHIVVSGQACVPTTDAGDSIVEGCGVAEECIEQVARENFYVIDSRVENSRNIQDVDGTREHDHETSSSTRPLLDVVTAGHDTTETAARVIDQILSPLDDTVAVQTGHEEDADSTKPAVDGNLWDKTENYFSHPELEKNSQEEDEGGDEDDKLDVPTGNEIQRSSHASPLPLAPIGSGGEDHVSPPLENEAASPHDDFATTTDLLGTLMLGEEGEAGRSHEVYDTTSPCEDDPHETDIAVSVADASVYGTAANDSAKRSPAEERPGEWTPDVEGGPDGPRSLDDVHQAERHDSDDLYELDDATISSSDED